MMKALNTHIKTQFSWVEAALQLQNFHLFALKN